MSFFSFCRFCLVFVLWALVGAFVDVLLLSFPVQHPTYRISNRVYYWVQCVRMYVVVVFTLKAVPVSTQYFLTSVLVQLTRTPSVVTG